MEFTEFKGLIQAHFKKMKGGGAYEPFRATNKR